MDTARNQLLAKPSLIDWKILIRALDSYKTLGYTFVEVPWLVSERAVRHTFNKDIVPTVQDRFFVGSGEQSFIELELLNKLPKGKFVTMTPCFRDEPVLNYNTQLHFMKVELYRNDVGINESSIDAMVLDALRVMKEQVHEHFHGFFDVVTTEEGFDITFADVEVGSYGIREVNGLKWVYGTGLAEPRFSNMVAEVIIGHT